MGLAFELCEERPLKPGTEEYLNSEKYELRNWNLDAPGNLSDLIARINRIRRENPAFGPKRGETLAFHDIENDNLLGDAKLSEDRSDVVLVVANLDPDHIQSGWVELAADHFLDNPNKSYQMHDLLTGARFIWHGRRNDIELDPHYSPAQFSACAGMSAPSGTLTISCKV